MADREMGGRLDTQPAEHQTAQNDARNERGQPAWVSRPDKNSLDGLTETRTAAAFVDDRRRLERDLHDGVQNELVSLLVRLKLAEQDPNTPPALAGTFAVLADHATAALDSVREIAHGTYPRRLAKFGLREALHARAARAAVDVSLEGTAPRSTEEAEEAAYFSCSEAIQNAAKHAGHRARVTVGLHHDHGSLAVRIADDGPGFDPSIVRVGAGLGSIRDRVEELGGIFKVASDPGRGTVLTISLPWPARADRRQ